MEIYCNTTFDLSFLRDNILTEDELKFVNPTATLPFDEAYWLNFFNDGKKTDSLYFKVEGEIVGHVALKEAEPSVVRLCFVYINPKNRGKGLAKKMLALTEEHLISNYAVEHYQLNVNPKNTRALGLYKSMGFVEIGRSTKKILMEKTL